MELGHQNHNRDGLLGPNSIMVVYMDPLGTVPRTHEARGIGLGFQSTAACSPRTRGSKYLEIIHSPKHPPAFITNWHTKVTGIRILGENSNIR